MKDRPGEANMSGVVVLVKPLNKVVKNKPENDHEFKHHQSILYFSIISPKRKCFAKNISLSLGFMDLLP